MDTTLRARYTEPPAAVQVSDDHDDREREDAVMHDRQFEDLAKALAGGAPRRRILKGVLGGALGSALAVVGLREREADAVPACRKGQVPCNGRCISASRCCIDDSCLVQCIALRCFGFNQSFSINSTRSTFSFNQQPACERQCLIACSSGNCP
jgi:hypothetical protein